MKLYPPYIEGTLPAFYKDSSGIIKLTIPFSMNRAVSSNEVAGFILKLKTAQNNIFIFTQKQTNISYFYIGTNSYVEFDINTNIADEEATYNKLSVGQYYKVQIAYIAADDNETVGYYSNVGIIKYTTQPTIYIQSLSSTLPNSHIYSYTGVYRQYNINSKGINEADVTEKEYSYQFILTDKKGNVIDDTGITIHNVDTNTEVYESIDEYKYDSDLIIDQHYYLQYIVYTNNKMTVKSPKYKLLQRRSIPPKIDAYLTAENNYYDGYINVQLVGNKNEFGKEDPTTGAFVITRACSTDNFLTWHEVFKFSLHSEEPSHQLIRDFTVEQGKEYIYALQQYNNYGLYSSKILSNVVLADFEDIFLYDGVRQLKVRFNPKVSSFKTTLLESKVDTIGSKYPFVFRNGKVAYKEFPISGLISYHMDENQLFMTNEELGLDDTLSSKRRPATIEESINDRYTEDDFDELRLHGKIAFIKTIKDKQKTRAELVEEYENKKIRTTQYEAYNIAAERTFKLSVLDWLNNGEIKLFRSPGEGNYLVRLMNVSLTPEDKTGRMIHNFQCTAYEMADFTYNNLLKYNITDVYQEMFAILKWESLELSISSHNPNDSRYVWADGIWYLRGEILTKNGPATSLRLEGLNPGSTFEIKFKNGGIQNIVIGATGNYSLNIKEELDSIIIPSTAKYNGILTYTYYEDSTNTFNEVVNFYIHERLGRQFIGTNDNILESLSDEKFIFLKFYYLHFYKRHINYIDEFNLTYYASKGNELDLYCVESDTIKINDYTIRGIIPIDSEKVKVHLISNINDANEQEWLVPECYYYYDNYNILQQSKGNKQLKYYEHEGLQFYEADAFKTYYDIKGHQMINKKDYNKIQNHFKKTLGRELTINGYSIYSTEIYIEDSAIDLEDIEHFFIDSSIDFFNIKLSNGTYLDCGYESQEVVYSLEEQFKEYNKHATYFEYNHYLSSDYFVELQQGNVNETDYNRNITKARNLYPTLYNEYLTDLVKKLRQGGYEV